MTTHDAINAVYEGVGALLICNNIRRVLKDKAVKGVSLWTTGWWTMWGAWNVYFYTAVGTPASFYAGIAVVVANAVWLALAVYYSRTPAPVLGPYGLPVCECGACKPVIPPGSGYERGWCGACGKDLVAAPGMAACVRRGTHAPITTDVGVVCWDCGAEL